MPSSDVKVPLSRIFRDRAEVYRAMADSIRGEQVRAISLKRRRLIAIEWPSRLQRLNLKMQTARHEAVTSILLRA